MVDREQLVIVRFLKFQEMMIELYGLLSGFSSINDPLLNTIISVFISLHNETSLLVTFYDEEAGILYKNQALSSFKRVVDLLNRLKRSLPQSCHNRQIDYALKLLFEMEKNIKSF